MTKSPSTIAKRQGQVAVLRILGWFAVAAIIVLSIVPGEHRPHTGLANYIEHFAAYFVTVLLLLRGYFLTPRSLIIALLLTALALILEIAQLWVSGRMARITDFAAGAFGVWTGIAVAEFARCARRA